MNGQRRRGFLRDNALSLAFLLLLVGSLLGQAISGVAGTTRRRGQPASRRSRSGATSPRLGSRSTPPRTGSRSTSSSPCSSSSPSGSSSAGPPSRRSRATRGARRTRNSGRPICPGGLADVGACGGWRTAVYSHSLLITMTAIFVLAWLAQAVADEWLTTRSGCATSSSRSRWGSTSPHRTSGAGPSRTGSRRCSPSRAWRSSRSTCASAGPRVEAGRAAARRDGVRRMNDRSSRHSRRPAPPRLDDPGRDLAQLDVAVLGRLLQPGERLSGRRPVTLDENADRLADQPVALDRPSQVRLAVGEGGGATTRSTASANACPSRSPTIRSSVVTGEVDGTGPRPGTPTKDGSAG